MSDIAISTLQENLERSIFETIRLELVDKGYLPDITDTVRYPQSSSGMANWNSDLNTIKNDKGFYIELYGTGIGESKGIKSTPRIVIESDNFLPGALGGDPLKSFIWNTDNNNYDVYITPPQSVDFYINFRLVANSIKQLRILNSLLAISIPRRAYIKFIYDSTKSFFIRYLNYYQEDQESSGVLEHVYAYEIPDCWDREDNNLESIASINELTLNINLQKYMDGSWGYYTDELKVNN